MAVPAAEPEKKAAPAAGQWDQAVDKAIAYLKAHQSEDGSWGSKQNIGITGIVLTGMLETGKVTAKDPVVEKGLKYIESLINTKEGHIAGKDPKVQLKNYVTCVNVMALTAADRDSYKAVIADAAKFLKELQWDEGEGKSPKDDFFGGAGYDSHSRPDLSNTQFFLDALVAAGVPKDDPAYKKAMVFVSRCQNLKGENNDQPWAGKIDDGSFIYTAAAGGQTKVKDDANPADGLPGYGSMTYAGIKSLIYCGVTKEDPRVKKAYEWIQKNYTVDQQPRNAGTAGGVGPLLLLPHDGQVPRRAGRGRGDGRQGRKARLARRHHRRRRLAAKGRRQLGQREGPLDGRRPGACDRLRPHGPEPLQAEEIRGFTTKTQRVQRRDKES